MKEVKKKRGRPREEGARRNRVYMYLSDIELDILKNASETSGKSISEIARIGTLKSSCDVLTKSVRVDVEEETVENDECVDEDNFYDE